MKQLVLQLISLLLSTCCLAQEITIELNSNWQFRQKEKAQWYPAEVPGTIHTDLLANKLIPDPFSG